MSKAPDADEDSFLKSTLQIPCFRKSFLYGISGGIGSGLISFLMTSHVKKSTNIGFCTYIGITLFTWTHCRINLTKERIQGQAFKKIVEEKLINEGSNENPNIILQNTIENSLKDV